MATATDPGAFGSEGTAASCCSAFYEQDWVRAIAEDSFHPGGANLTRRTVESMQLPANARLLDLGCGTGTTALLVSREFEYQVTGVDLSAANIERARQRANSPGVCFETADARSLPFDDGAFDGILAECVFSLLADKPRGLAELRRVLAPGGRIGLTDMALGGVLPADVADVAAPWTCLSDALDEAAYRAMFSDAGFTVSEVTDESATLTTLLGNIKRKLLLVGAGGLLAGGASVDLATARHWLQRFNDEVANGTIRYLGFQLDSG